MDLADTSHQDPLLGVAITAFRSEKIIGNCLDSLLACRSDISKVVVTDNDSGDGTCAAIRTWAAQNGVSFAEGKVGELREPTAWLTLLNSPVNGGFAYATNRSIEVLQADPAISLFWLLNPDCIAAHDAAAIYRRAGRDGDFSLMGGRTVFEEARDLVQTDGGRVSLWTGVCASLNHRVPVDGAAFPEAGALDFITGANCVASRRFIETVGLMEEDYFLYYEEVDWALRRGSLPLRVVEDAVVCHVGGTSIGSGSINRRPSPFSNYFNYRNRMRFIRRFNPAGLPVAMAYAVAKAMQLYVLGAPLEAKALLAGIFERRPPEAVRAAVSPKAHEWAFGSKAG